jgi:hypothetical protein
MFTVRGLVHLLSAGFVAGVTFCGLGEAQSPYDGDYFATLVLARAADSGCSQGATNRLMTVKNGQMSFAFNSDRNVTISGTVAVDGSVNGFAAFADGTKMSGKIDGPVFVGTTENRFCSYAVRAAKQQTWRQSGMPTAALHQPADGALSALSGQWKTQWPSNPGVWDVVMTITNVTSTAIAGSIWAYRAADRQGGQNIPFSGTVSPDGSYSFRIPNGNGWDGIRLCGTQMCAIGFNAASATHTPLVFTHAQ